MECCCGDQLQQYLYHYDLSGWALFEYIVFCHVLWWIFYYFLLVSTRQSEEWCCRFITLVHGCLISFAAVQEILHNGTPIDFQYTPLTIDKKSYLSYMLSYFLFDFCWIHFFGNETWIIYAHHVASILFIINVLIKNYGGGGMSYAVAGLEFTNPYLQLRWFLRTHGYLNKPIHTVTELWFMFLFFVIRMIGGTVLLYYGLFKADTDIGMKISFLSIYGISLVLQWQIFLYFRKKYLHSRRGTNYIHSTTSISPYFQRRTLDPPDGSISDNSGEMETPPTTPFAQDYSKPETLLMVSPPVPGSSKQETPSVVSAPVPGSKPETPKIQSPRSASFIAGEPSTASSPAPDTPKVSPTSPTSDATRSERSESTSKKGEE